MAALCADSSAAETEDDSLESWEDADIDFTIPKASSEATESASVVEESSAPRLVPNHLKADAGAVRNSNYGVDVSSAAQFRGAGRQRTDHVLEVFDFPSSLGERHLRSALLEHGELLELRWVSGRRDALAVFASSRAAMAALSGLKGSGNVKLRTMENGSVAARRSIECEPVPMARRGAANLGAAQRMIAAGLGRRPPPRSQQRGGTQRSAGSLLKATPRAEDAW